MQWQTPISSKFSSNGHTPKSSQDMQLLQEFIRFSPSVTTTDLLPRNSKRFSRINSNSKVDTVSKSVAANRILGKDRAKTSRHAVSKRFVFNDKIPDIKKHTKLLNTLGITSKKQEMRMPIDLNELGKYALSSNCSPIDSNAKRFEFTDMEFSLPASRKDAEMLVEWVDLMLSKAVKEQNENPDKLFESTHMIYSACLNEIIKQVSVQCKERGMLMSKVWNAYQSLFEKALSLSKSKQEYVEETYINDRNRIHRIYQEQVQGLETKVKELEDTIEPLIKELAKKEEINNYKTIKEEKIAQRVVIIQGHYKVIKREVLLLREENRILKAKLENSELFYEEEIDGKIVKIRGVPKKIKVKNDKDIENVLKDDPVLTNIQDVNVHESSESFTKLIRINEKAEREYFQRDDYKDAETDMPKVYFADKEIFTDVIDLCGTSTGIKKRRVRVAQTVAPITVDTEYYQKKADEKIEDIFTQLEKEEEDILVVIERENSETLANEMKRKHNHIKKLVYTLREELFEELNFENMPHSQLLNLLYKSFNQALKLLTKHPLENLQDFKDEEPSEEEANFKRKQKLLSVIMPVEDDKKILRDTAKDALTAIKRVISTPIHKLKNVMFKKMLLKLITQFYDERSKDPNAKEEEFGVFVFHSLIKKFIMKKAAENRFNHLLSSCMKYKIIKRVKVFARFIGLYDAYDDEDLNFYLECLNFINYSLSGKAVPNAEFSESIKVPYIRCIECIKHFEKRLPKSEIFSLKERLEKFKENDKNNKHGVIDVDSFLEAITDLFHSNKQDHMNFMRCIYEAADLNEDGYLEFKEFELLLRHVSTIRYSPNIAQQLFDAFCESFSAEEEITVKAISFENLCELNTKHQVFTYNSMLKLSQVNSFAEAEAKIKEVLPVLEDYIQEIYWRFSEATPYEEHLQEMHHLVEALRFKMRNYKNPEFV